MMEDLMKKLHVVLCLFVGLLGGILSHYLCAPSVHAQTQAAPPKEVRAQGFVLVNDAGAVQGVFTSDYDSATNQSRIKLLDNNGRQIWSVSNLGAPRQLSEVIPIPK
jgi:hypothetical protein